MSAMTELVSCQAAALQEDQRQLRIVGRQDSDADLCWSKSLVLALTREMSRLSPEASSMHVQIAFEEV